MDQFTTSHLCCSLRPLSQVTEKLLEVENETMMKVADLEKLLLQKDKDLQVIRVSRRPSWRNIARLPRCVFAEITFRCM